MSQVLNCVFFWKDAEASFTEIYFMFDGNKILGKIFIVVWFIYILRDGDSRLMFLWPDNSLGEKRQTISKGVFQIRWDNGNVMEKRQNMCSRNTA